LRVLHIDLGREFRGGQHQVLLLLKALREAGHESTLLVRADSPIADPAFELGFPVKLASPFALQRFSYQHDVVHAHDAQSHTWAAILCRRPFVVSRRVAFPVSRSPLSRWKYGRPARFLAVSNFVASELQAAGVAQSKIDVVYDSLDVPPRRHEWHAGGPVVTLGSHDPKKGRDLVERASTIAGIPIHFSDDLPEDLATASVFVYISRSEGLGSAALLAMSMGVPVVASRIGGLMEVFEHGISGISVENNPEEIAAAITRVRSDVGLAKALAGAARTRIETMFSTKELVNKTLASYRRAIAG
jgi:glycosyltransferase involved in cell wall biosynthesis